MLLYSLTSALQDVQPGDGALRSAFDSRVSTELVWRLQQGAPPVASVRPVLKAHMQSIPAGAGPLTDLIRILVRADAVTGMNVLVCHQAMLPNVLLGCVIACVMTVSHRHQRVPLDPLPTPVSGQKIQDTAVHPLEAIPEVVQLRADLQSSLAHAQASADVKWQHDARHALEELLPETLRLHTRSGQTEAFTAELTLIREIGTRGQRQAEGQRQEEHRQYLEDLAGGNQDELKV